MWPQTHTNNYRIITCTFYQLRDMLLIFLLIPSLSLSLSLSFSLSLPPPDPSYMTLEKRKQWKAEDMKHHMLRHPITPLPLTPPLLTPSPLTLYASPQSLLPLRHATCYGPTSSPLTIPGVTITPSLLTASLLTASLLTPFPCHISRTRIGCYSRES